MSSDQKMAMWMRFGQPLEPVIEDYQRIFDAWQDGGVETVVVGRLLFVGPDGTVAAFDPNPNVYRDFGVEAPPVADDKLPERRKLLEEALTEAKSRGLDVFVFCPDAGQGPGGEGHPLADDDCLAARMARIRDVMEAFPMVDGGVLDGPELGYEIAPGHRSNIFEDTPETLRGAASDLGYDFDGIVAARDRFHEKLHNLKPSEIELRGSGDQDLSAWFGFRRDLLMRFYGRQQEALAQMPRSVHIGVGSRLPCFTALNGYDLREMAQHYSFILPKLYFFHRGFDGFYGTIGRYIQTLTEWSPGLSDADAMKAVEGLFGIQMPWVQSRFDLELGFPAEFFETFVKRETGRMLAAADSPEQVVPWVEAGREPHHGDPIGAGDLHRYLSAAQETGLQRFLFHSHTHLSESEWAVLTRLCGKPWHSGMDGYRPPDGMPWESRSRR